ncbi:MAG TPA: adenylate/guanylate cyclase domain-containing protein [Acidimicrobiia bacterium]|nr:adenylate/guanylate cyclase domain-containing protein [Acidimicrobiia bacterium]
MGAAGSAARSASSEPTADPGERRLVSVLFADLVGFTTFSEGRDPEDVRNMLTHFYEKCREIIGRYGGTTDKFIGDAVMGVWGAVGAHEDDAERATRAALELIDMVAGLGEELGVPELAARAGVLSGEASVGSGGNDQGLVVGDLVNTASRLQSIAPPGGVYVGASTKDLVGSAIEFRPVGEQSVKGKDLPVEVSQAVRVLALSTSRTSGDSLEGPFVGRDDELRLLKDQLHATGRESRARMVSVIGEGGIGKSRLAAELIRYIDGITEVVYYHRGRSPSYGDGVSFWALGEMIRQRAGVTEGEDPAKARIKLRTMVAGFAPSEDDQRWIEPRLAAVIGLAPNPPGDRPEHFAALRAFFQAISNKGTTLMVFEDLHWADDGLLDFIEELVERTTSDPILVLCLARPDLLERRPTWVASRKRTLSMHLSRLDDTSMEELVAGLAPGLSEPMVARIAERAAGVPLHAVEFVRMLLNTGQLVRDGDEFDFVGSDDEFPIPDSVSAIIGARIDRLEARAQSILRDASVLGLTFALGSLARLREESADEVESLLRDLTRQEIVEFDENPRSPERGQYRFVQGLIREVAYGRLSRQERVARHLAVAEMFESSGEPELAGVVASHYADAIEADPHNEELVSRACRAVVDAAERAEDLKSDAQAASLYERAAEMSADVKEQNTLRLAAAECLSRTGREDKGAALARDVLDWARDNEDVTTEMRAVTALSNILAANFEAVEAADITTEVYRRVTPSPDANWIALAQETSRAMMLAERPDEAIAVADTALQFMEELELMDQMLNTLINKGTALLFVGRVVEGSTILRGVAEMAGDRDLLGHKMRAVNNLVAASQFDVYWDWEAGEELERLSERVGNEAWVVRTHFFSAQNLLHRGRIDEALERVSAAEEFDISEFWADNFAMVRARAELFRDGFDEERLTRLTELFEKYIDVDDPQMQSAMRAGLGEIELATGRLEDALSLVIDKEEMTSSYPAGAEVGVLAAAQLRDESKLEALISRIEKRHSRGRVSRGLGLVAASYLAALRDDTETAEEAFIEAEDLWKKTNSPLALANARAVLAIVLGPDNEFGATKAAEARAFFEEHGFRLHLDMILSRLPDQRSPGLAM